MNSWSPLRTTKRFFQISLKIPLPQNFRIQPTFSGWACCCDVSCEPWTGNRKQEAVRGAASHHGSDKWKLGGSGPKSVSAAHFLFSPPLTWMGIKRWHLALTSQMLVEPFVSFQAATFRNTQTSLQIPWCLVWIMGVSSHFTRVGVLHGNRH